MSSQVAVVFTFKSIETIVAEGGTSAWRLDRNHARRCTYAVCTRNAHAEKTEGNEEHQSGFLVGKISDVVSASREGRYLIQFSEYAPLDVPNVWKGNRNPVSYTSTLEELGIDEDKLEWHPMPAAQTLNKPQERQVHSTEQGGVRPLSIADAREGLALTFGVRPEAIEITIRG